MKKTLAIVCTFLLVFGLGSLAFAHKVNVYAYIEGGFIKGQGYYARGSKTKGAKVLVRGHEGDLLAQGVTDSNGEFTIPTPSSKKPWTIELIAGPGHKAEFEIPSQSDPKAKEGTGSSAKGQREIQLSMSLVDSKSMISQIKVELDKALDSRLTPLQSQLNRLAEQGDAIGVAEIVGGLGWVLGLFGIAAYILSRRGGS